MNKVLRLLNISNMYPSAGHRTYGIFVKRFEDAIESQGLVISARAIISGKGRSVLIKTAKYLKFYWSIFWQVAGRNYDIVYVHYVSNSSPVLFMIRPFMKKPFVVNFHGGDLLLVTGLEKYTEGITSGLIRNADLLVVPSGYFKEEVMSKFKTPPSKIHVYPSGGIDLDAFRPLDRVVMSKKYDVEGMFVFGFVARIDRGKRWADFLLSIKQFAERNPNVPFRAVVVGNGLEIEAFHQLAASLQLGNNLLFLGERDHAVLPEIYNVMDAFVFATDNESLGLVGIEAMACGAIVIGSYVGGVRSYLENGVNGFAIDNSEGSIVEKIEEVYRLSPERKQQIRERGFETARDFDARKVTLDLANSLRALVIKR
jgi:glycosyltransferase involved in cell wall biosynthesis